MMRRKILTLATALMVSLTTMGQVPMPNTRDVGSTIGGGSHSGTGVPTPGLIPDNLGYTINGRSALAPATLLLLGLAAGVGGVKIYRNNQSNQKKGDTK